MTLEANNPTCPCCGAKTQRRPGHYWFRRRGEASRWEIVEVFEVCGMVRVKGYGRGEQWCLPLLAVEGDFRPIPKPDEEARMCDR